MNLIQAVENSDTDFKITVNKKKYYLRADTPVSRQEWVDRLTAACFKAQNGSDDVRIVIPFDNIVNVSLSSSVLEHQCLKISVVDHDTLMSEEYMFAYFNDICKAHKTIQKVMGAESFNLNGNGLNRSGVNGMNGFNSTNVNGMNGFNSTNVNGMNGLNSSHVNGMNGFNSTHVNGMNGFNSSHVNGMNGLNGSGINDNEYVLPRRRSNSPVKRRTLKPKLSMDETSHKRSPTDLPPLMAPVMDKPVGEQLALLPSTVGGLSPSRLSADSRMSLSSRKSWWDHRKTSSDISPTLFAHSHEMISLQKQQEFQRYFGLPESEQLLSCILDSFRFWCIFDQGSSSLGKIVYF